MLEHRLWSNIKVKFNRAGLFRGRCLSSKSEHLMISSIAQQLQTYQGGSVKVTFHGKDQSIAVVTVSNKDKRNAFTGSMCVQLHDIATKLHSWNTGRALIIRGDGGMFCAGADLGMARQIADSKNGERFSFFMQETLVILRTLPLISLALLRGQVLGGGAELMVACDLQLADADTTIGFIQKRMGITPGWAGATHLMQKVGYNKALDLLLTSRIVKSEEAKAIGLITDISLDTSSEELFLSAGLEYIEKKLGDSPPQVIHGLKAVLTSSLTQSYMRAVESERDVFKSLWGGEANMRALTGNIKHK